MKIALLQVNFYKVSGHILDLFQWKSLLLTVVLYIAIKLWKPHPILTILISAVVGGVFRFAGA